jgi:murein DD-endopeptidase MepM/ murein hydrolase activator NlpD
VSTLRPAHRRGGVHSRMKEFRPASLSVRAGIMLAVIVAVLSLAAAGAWTTWRALQGEVMFASYGRGGPLIRDSVTTAGPGDARLTHAAKPPVRKLCPVEKAQVSSNFGRRKDPFGQGRAFHGGIDFAGRLGAPVRAAAGGVVAQADFRADYGNVVRIDHGGGSATLYAHNHKLLVRVGDRVSASQQIALLGSTGRSTGPHLHFEVHQHGRRVDPKPYLLDASPLGAGRLRATATPEPLCVLAWNRDSEVVPSQ